MTCISSFSCYNVDMKQQKQDNFVIKQDYNKYNNDNKQNDNIDINTIEYKPNGVSKWTAMGVEFISTSLKRN